MKKTHYILIGIVIALVIGILVLVTTTKEKPFKKIIFDKENLIQNVTTMRYLDTVVYTGLKILNIKHVNVIILPIKNKPDLGSDIEAKAYIVYYMDRYYVFIDEMGKEESIDVLSHELIHLQQYHNKTLIINSQIAIWKNKPYIVKDVLYNDRPWEIDAFQKQNELRNKINNTIY